MTRTSRCSTIRIDIYPEQILASVYNECEHGTYLSYRGSTGFRIPISTEAHQKSVLLREGDHLTTSNGQWDFRWGSGESQVVPGPIMPPSTLNSLHTVTKAHVARYKTSTETSAGETIIEHNGKSEYIQRKAIIPAQIIKGPQTEAETRVPLSEMDPNTRRPSIAAEKGQILDENQTDVTRERSSEETEAGKHRDTIASEIAAGLGDSIALASPLERPGTLANSVTAGELSHGWSDKDFATVYMIEDSPRESSPKSIPDNEPNPMQDDLSDLKELVRDHVVENTLSEGSSRASTPGIERYISDSLLREAEDEVSSRKRKLLDQENFSTRKRQRREDRPAVPARNIDTGQGDTIIVNTKSRKAGSSNKKRSETVSFASLPSLQSSPSHSTRSHDTKPDPECNQSPISTGQSRGTPSRTQSNERYNSAAPVILFSSTTQIEKKKNVMKTLFSLGGRKAKNVNDATMLCVSSGPLKKTPKLVMAIAQGKDVVSEEWLLETHRKGRFPNPKAFLPEHEQSERDWKFNLSEAIERGNQGMTHLLAGYAVFCTHQLKKELESKEIHREFGAIATCIGAERVKTGLPPRTSGPEKIIVVGAKDDNDRIQASKRGHRVYNQDIITMAALRGVLELGSDEFLQEVPIKDESEE